MPEWCDDDALWDQIREALFTPKRLAETSAECDGICALLDLKPGDSILDMPCGVGRHSIELARRGLRITGVDRTRRYLDQARERARDAALDIEWVEADMRRFQRPAAFNAAINMFTSFGYFEVERENQQVLEGFASALRPGGKLLIDIMGLEVCARIFKPNRWNELPSGALMLEEVRPLHDWTRIENRWIFVDGSSRREIRFSLRLYPAAELKRMFEAAGFVNVRAYGSVAGTPYDHNAQRLVVVGTRPG